MSTTTASAKGSGRRGRIGPTKRRGASAVEFAVVAPVFFLFIFSMFEFGRIVMLQHALTNASRVGCRYAILATTRDGSAVGTVVRSQLRRSMTDSSDVSVSVTPSDLTSIASGTDIQVDVAVNYSDVSWIPTGLINPRISASSIQQRE